MHQIAHSIHLSAVRADTQYEFAKFMQYAIEKNEKGKNCSRLLLFERVSKTKYVIQLLCPNVLKWHGYLISTHVSSIYKDTQELILAL